MWLRRYAGALSILIVSVFGDENEVPNYKVQREFITIGGMIGDILLLRLLRLTRSLGEKTIFKSYRGNALCRDYFTGRRK